MSDVPVTIFGVLDDTARIAPDKVAAIIEGGTTRTYGELRASASVLAAALAAQGAQRGDRICLLLNNRIEWIELFFACALGGYVCVPANPAWTPSEIGYLLRHSEAKIVICMPESAASVRDALAQGEQAPCTIVVITDGEVGEGEVTYDYLTRSTASSKETQASPEEAAMIVYTSGTTSGRPKGVVQTHRVVLEMGLAYGRVVDATADDRCLFVTPLFHLNAIAAVLGAFANGGSVVFPPQFSATRFWRLVDTYRPTYFFTLAPIVNILMTQPPSPLERNHGMRAMFVLAAGARASEIEERLATRVIDCYGMSELPTGTYTRLGEKRRPGSAGRPFFENSMRIVDDQGSDVPVGETGEVIFATAHAFQGYFKDAEETARTMRDGWFHTGDLGRFDEDGHFYFADRKKDIIRRGGENISSVEVETALRVLPSVTEVAVVPAPDHLLGERVCAVVVPADDAAVTLESLRAGVAGRLSEYKLPEYLLLVADMPRTPTGKIQKFAIRQLAADHIAAGSLRLAETSRV
jgi:acyl-CoA synthetase (AMP-forming)/AMP-acid ligase II